MNVFFTPFTFIFSSLYLLLIFMMVSSNNFFIFWFFMEMSTLVFMGVSYSVFKNNFSQLLIFFVIQTIAAFLLLIFFCYSNNFLFSVSLLLKLAMFPFFSWYLDLVYMFPNFLFFFSSTFFKIPSMILVLYFMNNLDLSVMVFSSVLTLMVGSLIMIFTNDFRFLLLASSISNNSWFLFSQLASFWLFTLYILIYSFFLFFSLKYLHSTFNSSLVKSLSEMNKIKLVLPLIVLSGMPPFPIFFLKMIVLMYLIMYYSFSVVLILVLLSNVLMLCGYLKCCFFLMMNLFSNQFLLSFNSN